MKLIFGFLLLFLTFINLDAQNKTSERAIIFDDVKINSLSISQSEWEQLVISDKDSIQFSYSLDAGSNEKTPFLFEITLSDAKDSYSSSLNVNSFQYKNLHEGVYEFSVAAFDQRSGWKVEKKTIKFLVNNKFKLLKDDYTKIKQTSSKKTALKDTTNTDDKSAISNINVFSVGIGFFAALLASFLAYVLKEKFSHKPKSATDGSAPLDNTDAGAKKLFEENLALKAEINAIRSQIDAMQSRGNEMKKRNKELEDQIYRLNATKDELETLQEQKDELFAMIIHDIKNPASLIKSLVELLRSYDLTANEQQDVMNDIVATTKRIVALSHEVSRVLALEGGKLVLDMETVDVAQISKDVHTRNNVRAREKGLNFVLDVPDNLPLADVDPQKIDEVMDNLISNAIKFTPSGGSIRIKGQKIDDTIVYEISDTGLGLNEEDLQKAFKRGAMLSAKPTAGESSTGLGLWIVKKLIEAHGGRVWVRSTVGKGSTFAFSIPLHQKETKTQEIDMSA